MRQVCRNCLKETRSDVESDGFIIIPARNEEENIVSVIDGILHLGLFKPSQIIIVNNASTDNTAAIAKHKGVTVVDEPRLGYGNACLAGIRCIQGIAKWILIMDADGSDDPTDLLNLFKIFHDSDVDLLIGSRVLGFAERGSLGFIQKYGNWLTCFLIFLFYRRRFTDLGPLRMIRLSALKSMQLRDTTWGWNIEMQIRAIQENLKILEIPVSYRKRKYGVSKISGTLPMAIRVGVKILFTFFKLTMLPPKKS